MFKNTIIGSIILFLTLSMNVIAADDDAKILLGSWAAYQDDDTPGKEVSPETITFNIDEKFTITGAHPTKGSFRVKDNSMAMLIGSKNDMRMVTRTYQLTATELKFKNKKVGWVHYKRIDDTEKN